MSEKALHTDWIAETPRPEDAAAMAKLQAQSWLDTYQTETDTDRNAEVKRIAEGLRSPERIAVREQYMDRALNNPVAFYKIVRTPDDELVGVLFGSKRQNPQEIVTLHVAAPYHGTGVAQTLMQSFLDWSDPDIPIQVGVLEDNHRAQKFYEKFNFQITPETLHPYQESKHLLEIYMHRKAQNEIQS